MRRREPTGGLRVLLIDDDVDLSKGLVDALRLRGWDAWSLRPKPAIRPERLAASVAGVSPDAILLDVVMPVDVGRLVEEIRARRDLSHAVLLGCSGHALLAGRWSKALDGFLHKPFGLEELDATLREAVAMRRGRRVSQPSAEPRRRAHRSRRRGASTPRRA